jgi:hypothetical protein
MAADGSALDDLRARVVAAGGPANASMTFAKEWHAEELAAEQADSPPLEVDGVLDMT